MKNPAVRAPLWLVLCLVFLCGCAQQQQGSSGFREFATKLAQFVGLAPATAVFDAAASVEKIGSDLTKEQEYYLGRAVAANILSKYEVETNDELNRYISRVGAAVLSSSDTPSTFGGFHFQVLRSDEVNAMAAPGGFIFITTGMLNLIPDEDTLAAVIAHEISHVNLRHGVKAISQDRMQKILSSLGQLAGSLNCSEVVAQASLIFSGTVDEVVGNLMLAGYGREQEYEADAAALEHLHAVNYSPFSLDVLLEQLENHEAQASSGGWFKTHPAAADRRHAIAPAIAKFSSATYESGRIARVGRFQLAMRADGH